MLSSNVVSANGVILPTDEVQCVQRCSSGLSKWQIKPVDMLPPKCRSSKKPCSLCATKHGTLFDGTKTDLENLQAKCSSNKTCVTLSSKRERESITSPSECQKSLAKVIVDKPKSHVEENVIQTYQNLSLPNNSLYKDLNAPCVNTTFDQMESDELPLYPSEEVAPLLVIPSTINGYNCKALIDSGAAGNFISTSLVKQLGCNKHPLREPTTVRVANSDIMAITHFVRVIIHMEKFSVRLCFQMTQMPNDILLGYPFLTRFTPRIDWRSRMMYIKQ